VTIALADDSNEDIEDQMVAAAAAVQGAMLTQVMRAIGVSFNRLNILFKCAFGWRGLLVIINNNNNNLNIKKNNSMNVKKNNDRNSTNLLDSNAGFLDDRCTKTLLIIDLL